MSAETVSFIGVGDVHFERPDGQNIFRHVQKHFDEVDVLFANSEQMYGSGHTAARAHATYSHPRGAEIVADVGFDVISFANNHAMDWGPEGLLDTLRQTEAAGVRTIGAGATINEARKPVVIEKKDVRIGFLAYSCTGPVNYAAEDDKVGYAPVHAITTYEQVDYQPGTPPKIHSEPIAEQLATMEADIRVLSSEVDAVVVSFHWGVHFVPAVIPEYCRTVGHAAAKAGASLILGTHAHMLKGVEVFGGVPIFYGTGNFAFEMGVLPENKMGLDQVLEWLTTHYRFTPDPEYPTFPQHPDSKYTLMVEADFTKDGLQECRIVPCLVNKQSEPEPVFEGSDDVDTVMNYIQWVTAEEHLNAVYERIDDTRFVIKASGVTAGA